MSTVGVLMHVFILSVWREAETECLFVFQSSLAYIVSGKPMLHGETLFKKKKLRGIVTNDIFILYEDNYFSLLLELKLILKINLYFSKIIKTHTNE